MWCFISVLPTRQRGSYSFFVVYRPIRQFLWSADRSDSSCGVQTDETVFVVYRPIRQFLWFTDRSDSFYGVQTDQFLWCTDQSDSLCGVQFPVYVVYRPIRQFLWCTDRLDRSCTSAVLARCAGNPVTAATVGLTLGRDRVKGSPTPPPPTHP